ncbi:MAG: ABC transporter ATP-binding protein [Phycisphaeraceae bacterium]|nr:ABC transporter ATP-binding protein [Phycisphaeraceae bacterium]
MDGPAVMVEGMTKVFPGRRKKGEVRAVEGVSLRIERGEIFGLLGPNGAGKTTTLRMIAGLLRPTAGRAMVEGMDVAQEGERVRGVIGLVPEDAGLHVKHSVWEELVYFGALYGLRKREVVERAGPVIERLELGAYAEKRIGTLSRGTRQKVHLVRALIHRPRVLLLDEPTAGLDPLIAMESWKLLRELVKERGMTVVISSHHLEEVQNLCGRIAILKQRVVWEQAIGDGAREGVWHGVEVIEGAERLVEAVRRVAGVREARVEGTWVEVRLEGEARRVMAGVVRAVVEAGGEVVAVGRRGEDLRQRYARVIGESGAGA